MRRPAAVVLLLTALLGVAAPATAQDSGVLRQRAAQQQAELEAATRGAADATARQTAALEASTLAQREADRAARQARQQEARRREAEVRTRQARVDLSRYIAAVYRSGAADRSIALYSSLLDDGEPQALLRGLGTATRVGQASSDAFEQLERAEAAQERATLAATRAAGTAKAAAEAAAAAKAAADQVVIDAATRVSSAGTALAGTQAALAIALRREEMLARAETIARDRSAIPPAAVEGALARPVGTCAGGDLSGDNGRLALDALCPLWGTSGQLLRADAAAAFDAMSRAYGEEFGEPLCVTDSYRSLPEQVAVAAAKPQLAAVPGTSNHGWGVALDLCGGVQSFGTVAARVDGRAVDGVRLVPAGVGAGVGQQARAVALGVRRLVYAQGRWLSRCDDTL